MRIDAHPSDTVPVLPDDQSNVSIVVHLNSVEPKPTLIVGVSVFHSVHVIRSRNNHHVPSLSPTVVQIIRNGLGRLCEGRPIRDRFVEVLGLSHNNSELIGCEVAACHPIQGGDAQQKSAEKQSSVPLHFVVD